MSKLFNSLVVPILLYNCEICGVSMNNKKLQRVYSFDDKNKHELLQLKMAKIALGVHKKSNNMAERRNRFIPSNYHHPHKNDKILLTFKRPSHKRK